MGIDIFFYRDGSNNPHELMHSLQGGFIKRKDTEEMKLEEGNECTGYPLKIVFSQKRARVLFFTSEEKRKEWRVMLKESSGSSDILDFYKFEAKLGEGQFGVVFKATHISDGKDVAIKTAKKADMDAETLNFTRKEIDTLKLM
jgi:serine/threonine protein kinase